PQETDRGSIVTTVVEPCAVSTLRRSRLHNMNALGGQPGWFPFSLLLLFLDRDGHAERRADRFLGCRVINRLHLLLPFRILPGGQVAPNHPAALLGGFILPLPGDLHLAGLGDVVIAPPVAYVLAVHDRNGDRRVVLPGYRVLADNRVIVGGPGGCVQN